MAIAKSPFFTEISGRLGNIISYTVNGQQRLRGATGKYRDQKSPEQIACRNKLKYASGVYHHLDLLLMSTWKGMTKGTNLNGYNLFQKYNNRNFTPDGKVADYRSLKVCCGTLLFPPSFEVAMTDRGTILLTWDMYYTPPAYPKDTLYIAAYTPEKKRNPKIWPLSGISASRGDGQCEFTLPTHIPGEVHLYAFFKSVFTNDSTESFYIGSWTV